MKDERNISSVKAYQRELMYFTDLRQSGSNNWCVVSKISVSSRMPKKKTLTAEAKYEILREISFRIRDTFDLDEILNHLLDTVKTVLDYDAAGIFVLTKDVLHTPYHLPQTVISGIVQRGFDQRPPETDMMLMHGEGIVGHVIHSGEEVVIPDVRNDPRYIAGRGQTLSEIAVPIFRNKRSIGTLNLESDRVGAFDHDDLEVLRFLADAASISIEKSLQHLQILEKKRIEDQLRIAREVQERLLPTKSPDVKGYEIGGICLPAFDIGGDYFDYLSLPDRSIGIVVADVAGHGIPSSLLMMAFRALLLTNAPIRRNPTELMEILNRLIPEFTRRRDFITAFYGILDPHTHVVTFSNAGHNPPFILRADGSIKTLDPVGPGLNIISEDLYETNTVRLAPSDTMVLYTDGVIETFNEHGEDFGIDRLHQAIRDSANRPVKEMLDHVIAETQKFSRSEICEDDFTLVVVKRLLDHA